MLRSFCTVENPPVHGAMSWHKLCPPAAALRDAAALGVSWGCLQVRTEHPLVATAPWVHAQRNAHAEHVPACTNASTDTFQGNNLPPPAPAVFFSLIKAQA